MRGGTSGPTSATSSPDGVDLSDVTPHTFRKTVATILDRAENGGIDMAAELLGHSSTAVTEEHYVQPTKRVNPATAEILEQLGPGSGRQTSGDV